ncbi:hypothetical protein Tcan_00176 [Toxocara canis]|uniref:Uncharacterized protein n=1 Tax=Toxocara canis TaxID=6265 RepID=A0A0B2UN77_TOXCA|nr:hypothetical protein Tcan_00176 [Toxocara canis]
MHSLFMLGYRQHNRWIIFAYFFSWTKQSALRMHYKAGIFVALLVVTFSFSLAFLRDLEHAPPVYRHDQSRFGSYYNTSDFYEKNPNVLSHDIVLCNVRTVFCIVAYHLTLRTSRIEIFQISLRSPNTADNTSFRA